MTVDLSSYKVAGAETSSSTKFDNFVQAVETALNTVGTPLKTTTSTLAGGPPGSPADGDIWIATAVDASGTRWQFQFNNGSASTYKWEFIGGPPAVVNVATSESTTAGPYQDLATVGPSFVTARGGDYLIEGQAEYDYLVQSGQIDSYLGVNVSGAVAIGVHQSVLQSVSFGQHTFVRSMPGYVYAAVAASATVKLQYGANLNGGATTRPTVSNRQLSVLPRRVI